MSIIYPRLALDYGGVGPYYLPPYSGPPYGAGWGAEISCLQGAKATVLDDPLTDGMTLSSASRAPARFEIAGEIVKATADDARVEMRNMLTALAGGADGAFKFFWFHDQYWRHCFVEGERDLDFDLTRAQFGVIGYRIRFTAGDPAVYTDDEVGAGPYEDDIYPGETGATVSSVKQKTSYAVIFPGEIIVTPTGSDQVITPESEAGDTLEIVSLQATCLQLLGASGSTQLRVSDQPKGGATTNSILLTLEHNAKAGRNTGSFTLNAGAPLYVYCEAAAGHQDLMLGVVVEG